jgi:hypothetical protein
VQLFFEKCEADFNVVDDDRVRTPLPSAPAVPNREIGGYSNAFLQNGSYTLALTSPFSGSSDKWVGTAFGMFFGPSTSSSALAPELNIATDAGAIIAVTANSAFMMCGLPLRPVVSVFAFLR